MNDGIPKLLVRHQGMRFGDGMSDIPACVEFARLIMPDHSSYAVGIRCEYRTAA